MSKIIDWIKKDTKLFALVMCGFVFVVGIIAVAVNSGDTYAATYDCYKCLDGTGYVWSSYNPGAGFVYANGDSYSTTATACGPGFTTASSDSYCGVSSYYRQAYFNANGGTLSGSSSLGCSYYSYESGCTISGLPTATRTGYIFKGWGTSSSCTSGTTSSITISSDTTYYACWSAASSYYRQAYFNANGGTLNGSSSLGCAYYSYESGCTITNLPTATRSGYTFNGWGTSSSCTSGITSSITISSDTTYYACWSVSSSGGGSSGGDSTTTTTYTISYDANGGSGAPSAQTKTHGTNLTLSSTVPTRTGYTFLGWSTNKSATSATYSAGSTYTTDASATLYAVWKANTYTISYDANGGSGAPSSQTKTYGVNLTLSSTVPTKTGYTFDSWNTKADGTGTSYKAGATFNGEANTTLYAQYTANEYSISYVLNGGVVTGNPTSATYDKTITIKNPSKVVSIVGNDNSTGATIGELTSSEQEFVGWTSSDIDTTTAYYDDIAWKDIDTLVTSTSFKNLTPVNKATVTLVANFEPVEITLPTVSKDGYTCTWNTQKDGKGTSYNSGSKYIPAANSEISINLYAICEANTKADEEITTNSKTGNTLIVVAWLVGITALGYSVYYIRSRKTNI